MVAVIDKESSSARSFPMLSRSRALVLFVLVMFSVVFFLRLFVFSLYSVSTGSMENTLIPGDRIIVTGSFLNHSRLGEPKRGDIIIFRDDAGWLDGTPYAGETLNKRVIGIPGDTVIGSEDGTVMVNGAVIDEPYLKSPAEAEVPKSLNVFNITLGKDEFWVMGDNRGNSDDSRYNGPISRGSIVGIALYLAYPFSRFANFS